MPSPDFSFHGCAPASVAPTTSTFSQPLGAQVAADRHAGAAHRVLVEVRRREPLGRRDAGDRQPERHLARLPVRVELEAARSEAAGRQHDPVGRLRHLAQPDADAQRRDAIRRTRSAPMTTLLSITRPPAPAQPVAQRLRHAHARHRRRQRRHLEDGPPELLLQRRASAVAVERPAPPGRRRARRPRRDDRARDLVPERRGRRTRARSRASSRRRGPRARTSSSTDARVDAGAPQVVGEQRGVEVLERAEADDADRVRRAVAGGHRLRHERRRLQRADRGRQQQVLLEAADVGYARLAPPNQRARRRSRRGRRASTGGPRRAGPAASSGRSTRSGA